MKLITSTLAIPELKMEFSTRESVCKAELRKFYRLQNPDLTEHAFRRILYSLEKEGLITPLGAGVYALLDPSLSSKKKKFIPNFSAAAQDLNSTLQENFPYTQYLIWETRILHDLMTHQPGQSQIILEVDKEACESVFNFLNEQPSRKIFLEPNRVDIERYIINFPESILQLRLVTQSPKIKKKGIISARLEKILVDIFTDENRFFTFHGQEMINIFENAFLTYWINTKTLFRYAGRRKVAVRLKNFIDTQTQIESSSFLENIE
jgi:hypothetical protein